MSHHFVLPSFGSARGQWRPQVRAYQVAPDDSFVKPYFRSLIIPVFAIWAVRMGPFLCVFLVGISTAMAGLRAWTGNGGSANWSTPNNWSPSGPPQNGDDLLFPSGTSQQANMNDLVNLSLSSMAFNGASSYVLSGNGVIVTNGVSSLNQSGGATVGFALTLAQDEQFTADNALLILNGGVNLAGHNLTLMAATNSTIPVGGVVSGVGNVIKLGTGAASFGGASGNTYSGALLVYEGTFYLGKSAGSAVPGPLVIGHLDNFTFGHVTLTGNNQIVDTATITINHGDLNLNGWNEGVGPLVLYDGGISTGAGLLTLLGTVTQPSWIYEREVGIGTNVYLPADRTFQLDDTDGCDLSGVSGPGGIVVQGIGELFLSGTNSFVGPVTVNGGRVTCVESPLALAGSSGVTLNNFGSLGLWDAGISNKILTVNSANAGIEGSGAWAGPIFLNFSGMAYCNGDTALTLAGPIHGTGGLWFGNFWVQLAGSDNNDYTGLTRAACQLLLLNKTGGAHPFAGNLEAGGAYIGNLNLDYYDRATNTTAEVRWLSSYQAPGTTLIIQTNGFINLTNHNEDFGAVTFNGGRVDTGVGQFAAYQTVTVNPANVSAIINGFLGLPAGADRIFNVGDGVADCDLVINAVVFGDTPYFRKQGSGTMCLAGANTYSGVTLVQGGTLDLNNGATLGSAASGTVIFDGATLRLTGAHTVSEGFEMVGAGVGGTQGAVEVAPGGSTTMNSSILLDAGTTFNVGASASLTVNAAIAGTGPLTKIGAGLLTFTGSSGNTYSGDTVVTAGTLELLKSGNVISVPHNLVVGPATALTPATVRLRQVNGMLSGNTVTVNASSLFDLSGNNHNLSQLHLNDGGDVQTGAGVLGLTDGAVVAVGSVSLLGSHSSSSISGNVGLTPNGSATFSINPYAPSFPFDSNAELEVPALILVNGVENPSLVPAGFTKTGTGRMRVTGSNTYKGRTLVSDGTLQVDGAQPPSFVVVNSGAQLRGAGTVGHLYMNGSTGVVAPGDSPGILTCSNLDNGGGSGIFQVELNGTAAGSGYDQLNVRGTVNLTGITLKASLGYNSLVGDLFTIIANDGTDAVVGTFNGLPQNAKLYIDGQLFDISYVGNGKPGNDVVLRRLTTPPPPLLTIGRAGTNLVRLLWPTNDPPFRLISETNLTAGNWSAVSPSPVVIGTNDVVTNTATDVSRFYRLVNP
jgi:autotransporter-associated beta strand protein